jgi:hypothetical protein
VASALQERVVRFFAFKSEGKSINDIRNSKAYKNPDILEKLVQHCGINEIGSNYPPELFDPLAFQPTDFYDSIGKVQKKKKKKTINSLSPKSKSRVTHITLILMLHTALEQRRMEEKRPEDRSGNRSIIYKFVNSLSPPPFF